MKTTQKYVCPTCSKEIASSRGLAIHRGLVHRKLKHTAAITLRQRAHRLLRTSLRKRVNRGLTDVTTLALKSTLGNVPQGFRTSVLRFMSGFVGHMQQLEAESECHAFLRVMWTVLEGEIDHGGGGAGNDLERAIVPLSIRRRVVARTPDKSALSTRELDSDNDEELDSENARD